MIDLSIKKVDSSPLNNSKNIRRWDLWMRDSNKPKKDKYIDIH